MTSLGLSYTFFQNGHLSLSSGFSAEISVVVQTGNSVQLHIQTQELPEFDDLSWKNDKSEIIVKYTSETKRVRLYSYKDRVDFNDTTFSLTLKNMQKTDSGLYRAIAAGESDNNIVTYRVSVIGECNFVCHVQAKRHSVQCYKG